MTRLFGSFANGNGDGEGGGDALRGRLDRISRLSALVGLVGLGLCVLGAAFDAQQVLRSYHMGYFYWVGLPLASTMLLLLIHLAAGTWGLIVRRLLEAGASTLILMAPLYLPVAIGAGYIYPWAGAEHGGGHAADEGDAETDHAEEAGRPEHLEDAAGDPEPRFVFGVEELAASGVEEGETGEFHAKEIWFNRAFYFGRMAGYFAIFGLLAFLLVRWSGEQDRASDPWPATNRLGTLSAPGLLVAFLVATFFMFDYGMALDPEWFSTLYGAMLIIGAGLQAFALTNFATTLLAERDALDGLTTPKRLRDLGNLTLAFVMLWAYTTYSQFLIIWSGDLTEEIPWYLDRSMHGWQYIAAFLVVFHFFLPFLVLLFRPVKESPSRLRAVSALILGVHVLDIFWLFAPSLGYESPVPHLLDLAAFVGVGGLWIAAYCYFLNARPLVARNAPMLAELRAYDRHHAHAGPHTPPHPEG